MRPTRARDLKQQGGCERISPTQCRLRGDANGRGKDAAEKARGRTLIDGARKEAALSWIGVQFDPERAAPIIAEFKRYYGLDHLRGDYTYAPTGEIVSRPRWSTLERRETA